LLGSLLALLQWEVLSYWMNSYWGGALAATGGALLLGAWPRLEISMRRQWKHAVGLALAMALGIAILANTRPYEGLMLTAPVLIALALRTLGRGRPISWRAVLSAAALLIVTAGAMMYYFWRVTGKPWLMPYAVHDRQYALSPSFIFLPAHPEPQYRHAVMAAWWRQERGSYDMARSASFPRYLLNHVYVMFVFYLGPAMLIAYLALWRLKGRLTTAGSNRVIRWLAGLLAIQFLAISLVAGTMPHYAAPSAALILLLAVLGLRRLRAWPAHQEWGKALVRVVVLSCVIRACLCVPAFHWFPASHADKSDFFWRCCVDNNANFDRAHLQERLEGLPGRQLVIVQYGAEQPKFKEYVYNLADIDSQRVVWARSMGARENAELLNYYRDRYAWLLTINSDRGDLRPYPGARTLDRQ
jgi:hypothetical protein